MKKRLLSALLVLVMILTMLPVMAFAEGVDTPAVEDEDVNKPPVVENDDDDNDDNEFPVVEEDDDDEEDTPVQEQEYTLTVNVYLDNEKLEVPGDKGIIVTGAGSHKAGDEFRLTVNYDETKYEFFYWENVDAKIDVTAFSSLLITMPDQDATLRAYLLSKEPVNPPVTSNSAKYTVNHWLETWNKTKHRMEYVLADTDVWTAEVDGYVTAQANSYAHYHWNKNHKDSASSGKVTADGGLELNLYYDLNRYTVTYTDGIRGVTVFKDQTYTVPYGAPTPKFDDTGVKLGLFFLGWKPSVAKTVTGDVTYVAQWADLNWNVSNVKKPTSPMSFTDVSKSDWFYSDVKYVYENGLMEGTSDTKFSPNSTLTRGMVATILWRMDGAPKTRYNGMFRDVDNYKWYTDGVEWAAAKGIVEGFEDGNFRPNDYVTREQLATMLYRYAQYKRCGTAARADLADYKDGGDTHLYAVTAVRWALANDLLSSTNGKVLPRADATRAEVAAAVATFCQDIMR